MGLADFSWAKLSQVKFILSGSRLIGVGIKSGFNYINFLVEWYNEGNKLNVPIENSAHCLISQKLTQTSISAKNQVDFLIK